MRKIEQEMIRAIRHGARHWKNDNTEVNHPGSKPCYAEVRLHGHLIASNESGAWKFNLCGCPTTRSRINALAREFGRPLVSTRGRSPFCLAEGETITRVPVPTEGWF